MFDCFSDKEEKTRRFRAMKLEWGYDRFIPFTLFNNPSNGYLVDDMCVFGAEVSVRKEIRFPGRDCLSLIKDPVEENLSWEFTKFNFTNDCFESKVAQYWYVPNNEVLLFISYHNLVDFALLFIN